MSVQTLFLSPVVQSFDDNVSDPSFARINRAFSKQIRYNVAASRLETMALASGDTRSVALPGAEVLGDWRLIMARVRGTARIETTGKDTNGTSVINGYLPCYGTDTLPGIVFLSTYNLTAITVRGQAAGTLVEFFYATAAEDV